MADLFHSRSTVMVIEPVMPIDLFGGSAATSTLACK